AVVAAEPVAPIVAYSPVLGTAGGGLNYARIGIDTEIAVRQRHGLRVGEARDVAAEYPAAAIDPAVEAVFQAIHARLVVVRGPAAEEFFHNIGLAGAFCILGIEDVRRGTE